MVDLGLDPLTQNLEKRATDNNVKGSPSPKRACIKDDSQIPSLEPGSFIETSWRVQRARDNLRCLIDHNRQGGHFLSGRAGQSLTFQPPSLCKLHSSHDK